MRAEVESGAIDSWSLGASGNGIERRLRDPGRKFADLAREGGIRNLKQTADVKTALFALYIRLGPFHMDAASERIRYTRRNSSWDSETVDDG